MIETVVITLLVCVPAFGDPHGALCSAIQDCVGVNNERSAQGRTGKAGPPGVPGVQGPPGNQGLPGTDATVDYQRISDLIDEKINQGLELHKSRVRDCKQEEGLPYGDVCYIVFAATSPYRLHYNTAVQICRRIGGSLAEIQGRNDQKHIADFARHKIPSSRGHLDFWLGIAFVRSGNHVRFKSGKTSSLSHFRWLANHPWQTPHWPRGSRTKPIEQLIIKVNKNSASAVRGLLIWPEPYSQGVICERPL